MLRLPSALRPSRRPLGGEPLVTRSRSGPRSHTSVQRPAAGERGRDQYGGRGPAFHPRALPYMAATPIAPDDQSSDRPRSEAPPCRSGWTGSGRVGILLLCAFILLLTVLPVSVGVSASAPETQPACHETCGGPGPSHPPSGCFHDSRCSTHQAGSGTASAVGVLEPDAAFRPMSGASGGVPPRTEPLVMRDIEGRLYRPPRTI